MTISPPYFCFPEPCFCSSKHRAWCGGISPAVLKRDLQPRDTAQEPVPTCSPSALSPQSSAHLSIRACVWLGCNHQLISMFGFQGVAGSHAPRAMYWQPGMLCYERSVLVQLSWIELSLQRSMSFKCWKFIGGCVCLKYQYVCLCPLSSRSMNISQTQSLLLP